jgi:hypothetical protein
MDAMVAALESPASALARIESAARDIRAAERLARGNAPADALERLAAGRWYLATADGPEAGDLAIFTKDKHKSNSQNVHYHGVSTALRQNVKALTDAAGPVSAEDVVATLDAVTDAVLTSDHGEAVKTDALALVDNFRRPSSSVPHSVFQCSAPEVLAALWKLLQSPGVSEARRKDLTHVLVAQLSTGIESGIPVCLSGKIARIMGVLDGQELDILGFKTRPTLPMWAVKEELATLAAKCRDEASSGPGSDRDCDGGAKAFADKAKALYVRELGMSEAVVIPIVAEMQTGF